MKKFYYIFILFIILCLPLHSFDTSSISVILSTDPSPGYYLTGPLTFQNIDLVDNYGGIAYTKVAENLSTGYFDLSMQPNGNLTAYSIRTSRWLVFDKNFNMIDSIDSPPNYFSDFHDILVMNNGHYLLIGIQSFIKDMSTVVTGGNTQARISNYFILELDQSKNIVWTWNFMDHFKITDATDDIDLTTDHIDPFHCNSLFLDADGNVIISSRNMDEVTKINKQTGAIIWRMGGTKCKNNQFTIKNDSIPGFIGFSHQHNAIRLTNGNLTLFDNGNLKPDPQFSRAVEYSLNESSKTITKVWEYRNSPDIISINQGNVQRLPSGNTLVCWGSDGNGLTNGILATEVTPDGTKVFEMQSAAGAVYRCFKVPVVMEQVTKNVSGTGNYDLTETNNATGVHLNITSIGGSGKIWVQKHHYQPYNLAYFSNAPCSVLPMRWTLNKSGISSFSGKISLDVSVLGDSIDVNNITFYFRANENSGYFDKVTTTYNSQTKQIVGNISGFGELMLGYNSLNTPQLIYPTDNSSGLPLSFTARWDSLVKDIRYDFQLSTDINFSTIISENANLTLPSVQVNNLQYYTTYYWRVKRFSSDCSSDWSKTTSFTTNLAAPILFSPTNSAASQSVSGTIKWDSVPGAKYYKIQIAANSEFNQPIVNTLVTVGTSFNYSSLTNNTIIYWRVSAGINDVLSDWSSVWNFSTELGIVKLLLPVNNSYGIPVSGNVRWNTINGADSYHVQIATDQNFTRIIFDSAGITDNFVYYDSLSHSKIFYWHVKGINNQNIGNWSDTWNFQTIVGTPNLNSPHNKTINISIQGGLIWKNVDSAIGYNLQLSKDSVFSAGSIVSDSVTSANLCNYTGLDFSKTYYWRVRAKDNKIYGAWSSVFSFMTQAELYIAMPQLIKPDDSAYTQPVKIELDWEQPYNAQYYNLQVSTDTTFLNSLINADSLKTTSFTTTALDYDKQYFWRLRAYNSKTISDWSEIKTFTTKLNDPVLTSPSDKSTNIPSNTKLVWAQVQGAKKYNIQVSFISTLDTLLTEDQFVTDNLLKMTKLDSGKTYYWRVMAYDGLNTSNWSPVYSFFTSGFSSVFESYQVINNLEIFPNPANEFLYINIPDESFAVSGGLISIFSSSGEKVLETNVEFNKEKNILLNVSLLNNGLYVCRIISGTVCYTGKFILIK